MENSGDFSDELDEFEESHEDVKKKVRFRLDLKCFVLRFLTQMIANFGIHVTGWNQRC